MQMVLWKVMYLMKYCPTHKKIKSYAALSNFNNDTNYFDFELAHNVLSDSGKREKLINQMYNIVIEYGYDGVNIDLESINPEDRDLLTLFVKETSKKFIVQVILLRYRFQLRVRMIVRIHGHLIMSNKVEMQIPFK
ncbi:glycosyl hydrolase family 18 protein [Bacillus toyonensis]|uniref:glycosyl hydrolase family 18 protein n=2 Tax=Bacillus toyonensis TaxID=155322 RepID=UPI00211D36B6|nr:glycosyl hydrolase family 18 protein [Bacillus toyonensis]